MVKESRSDREMEKELKDFARYIYEKYGVSSFSARLFDESKATSPNGGNGEKGRSDEINIRFSLKPKEIKAQLDKCVIKQEEAKKYLANAAFYHYKHVEKVLTGAEGGESYQKNNIIMVGSTGVGKTLLLKQLARILGVPFVKGDATKFSKTGYVGQDVENLVRELVREAEGNVRLAECGMVFIDEIDKIAADKGIIGRDISGTGVQTELLKLLEDTDVDMASNADPFSMMEAMASFQKEGKRKAINTRNILFIVGGAFPGLEEIIKKRMLRQRIGFKGDLAERKDRDYLRYVRTEDFVEFGMLEEFVGRLPVRVTLEELYAEDFFKILKYSESSILKQHIADFATIGVNLRFTDDAVMEIAEKAMEEHTGARGLMTVCERLLADFKYEFPGKVEGELLIDREVVNDPKRALEMTMIRKPMEKFVEQFKGATQIELSFDDSAVEYVRAQVREKGTDPVRFCWERLNGCDRIVELMGKKELIVTRRLLENPMKELGEMMSKSLNAKPNDLRS